MHCIYAVKNSGRESTECYDFIITQDRRLYIAKVDVLQLYFAAYIGAVHEGVVFDAKKISPFVEPIDGVVLVVKSFRVIPRILPEDQNR